MNLDEAVDECSDININEVIYHNVYNVIICATEDAINEATSIVVNRTLEEAIHKATNNVINATIMEVMP